LLSEKQTLFTDKFLVKQVARLFPVYFNEIGAEGELRDISTDVDELTRRKDVLIHFLRKQSYVESSNFIVKLTEEILTFWHTLDKTPKAHLTRVYF
jgi:pyruvate,orthophosphate dikinase